MNVSDMMVIGKSPAVVLLATVTSVTFGWISGDNYADFFQQKRWKLASLNLLLVMLASMLVVGRTFGAVNLS